MIDMEQISLIEQHKRSVALGRVNKTKNYSLVCIQLMEKGIFRFADISRHNGYSILACKKDFNHCIVLSLLEAKAMLKEAI